MHAADPPRRLCRRRSPHRVDARERLAEDERERVEVGRLAHLAPLALLGRHVGERAEHVAGASQHVLAGQAGAAEVGQLGGALRILWPVGNEHVLGLDVAVDHAARVRVGESVRERDADLEHLLVVEPARGDQLRERLAVDELGDQVERLADGTRLVQGDDRRVRQPRAGERLAARALAVSVQSQRDPLDGHLAVQQLVVGAPDHPEAAGAETLDEPVTSEHETTLGRARIPRDGARDACRGARALQGCRRDRRGAPGGAGDLPDRAVGVVRRTGADEGAQRLHRILRSPSVPSAPCRGHRERTL